MPHGIASKIVVAGDQKDTPSAEAVTAEFMPQKASKCTLPVGMMPD